MKKLKFVLPSLLSISLVPAISLTSCGPAEQRNYEWSIDGSRFTYQLISSVEGKDFKLKIVADQGFGISASSYFTIGNGEQHELELYENVLTITADKINGKIDIYVVTIPLPNSISITYGESQIEPATLLEGNTLDFNVTVDPVECADNVKLISGNENIAKFDGNKLVPVSEGGPIWVKAVVDVIDAPPIESNIINVTVQSKPSTDDFNDDNVPLEIEPIYGTNEVGFLYRNFKADFDIKTREVKPSIVWADSTNADDATIEIVNVSNDRFNKSTFDIYITYSKDKYDSTQHLINIKLEILDVGQVFTSKQLTMLYKSSTESKTIDVSNVPKQVSLVDGKTVTLTGFSANFKFTEDGYDQIVFQIVSNYALVFSDNIININYDLGTNTTTFDLQLELYVRDLTNDEIGTSIYLDNVLISTINTTIDYGQAVLAHAHEVKFVNGNKPSIETNENIFETNFDFRISGEPDDGKPLITVEWPTNIPLPAPASISVVRKEGSNREFGVKCEWNSFVNVSSYDSCYQFSFVIKVNGNVTPTLSVESGILMIESIKPTDLKQNVIMEENDEGNSTLSLYAFIRGVLSYDDCVFNFKSDSALLKDSNPTVEWNRGETIRYYDGIFLESITLTWNKKIEITGPTKFSISIDKSGSEGYNLLKWTEFTIEPPEPERYWSIDTSGCRNSKVTVTKNTRDEIELEVSDITSGYQFFGAYVKQEDYNFPQTIDLKKLSSDGIITIHPIQDDPEHSLRPNAYTSIATMYYDPADSNNNVFLNKYFDNSVLGPGVSAVKNDKPMTVKGNNPYYLDVDTKNWQFTSEETVKGLTFVIGNIKNFSTMLTRTIDQDTEVFVNGAAIVAKIRTMGNISVLVCELDEEISIEDFKNLDIKILAITDKDAMDCEFNLVCTGDN